MPRTFTTSFRNEIEAPASSELLVCFATLTHGSLSEPVRAVCDVVDYLYGGNRYYGVPFEFVLLDDGERPPRARLRMHNVDLRIGQVAQALLTSPRIRFDVMAGSDFGAPSLVLDAATGEMRKTRTTLSGNDSYTKILLHFDGADASTAVSDTNAGGSSRVWAASGNAQIDNAQYRFGGASALFDGTGDYATTADSADFTLGNSDWTVDCWFNCLAPAGAFSFLAGQVDAAVTPALSSIEVGRTNANVIFLTVYVGASTFTITGTTSFTDATNRGWHHVAAVRAGNTLKLFIDGVQEGGSLSIAGAINDSTQLFGVGSLGGFVTAPWQGWIDEFRLSVGIARWTDNFTPPSQAYDVAWIEYTADHLRLANVSGDAMTVEADIESFDLTREPWPSVRATRDRLPGLFR